MSAVILFGVNSTNNLKRNKSFFRETSKCNNNKFILNEVLNA